ncbi:hypothetical protein DICPUDRAFT_154398 [Dictyostelium purpureum]|uniref:IPT/TIG domain-containing protein n=1 Tax=Dictyostelium purpureum TaxID=5786 RepID=F0ZR87_DICPU|nr:uncharacterized protein DICPUDRAFT_154398 [Dictyostelium purpureum]EGC33554.1 hypothetical protein DICPUDRAFT_154398 [Dictyostelium purpureum]|eukprot:XP_003289936.1 hypothetical protein DICPUDRAFT_154398 [Dictyostelium purpureum]
MNEGYRKDIIRYLSVLNNLGGCHIDTINGFLQKPSYIGASPPVSLFPSSDGKSIGDALYQLSIVLERMTDNEFDDTTFYHSKQLKSPLGPEEVRRLNEISLSAKVTQDYMNTIGRVFQSYQLFELLSSLEEQHITLISKALTSIFPMDQSITNDISTSKQKNYQGIIEKIKQLFSRTKIELFLHLREEIEESQKNPHKSSISQATILDTLDIKSSEYYLASALRQLLSTDENSLTTLVNELRKIQPLQITQLSLLPFKDFYQILDLQANFIQMANTYQFFKEDSNSQFNISTASEIKMPSTPEIKIVDQPPDKAIYKRNVKPAPSVSFQGDSKDLDGNYYVSVALLRCNDFSEEPTFLNGASKPTKITNGKIVTFKKLKVMVTSHQQGETLFCFRFDLRRYSSDPETNPNDFEIVSSVHSSPISILSHSTQLKSTAIADLPKVTEVFPLSGPSTGGTRICLLGSNFADTPAIRLKFGNVEIQPEFFSGGTLVCNAPEHPPGTVQIKVSNCQNQWSVTSATFTFEDTNTINPSSNISSDALSNILPESVFGLDFSKTFDTNFIIKGLETASSTLPSSNGAHRNYSKQY